MAEHHPALQHGPNGGIDTLPHPDIDQESFDAMMAGAELALHEDGDFDANPDTPTDPETALEETPDGKFRIVVVGLDRNIRAHAMEAANRVLNEKTQGEGVRGLIKNAFRGRLREVPKNIAQAFRQSVHGNIAREAVLDREYKKARDAIIRNQNLLVNQNGEVDDYRLAELYRFGEAADQYEELIQQADDEKRTKISLGNPEDGEEDPIGEKMRGPIRSLMERASAGEFDDASGAFNRAAFDEEVKAMMVEFATDPELSKYLGKGLVQISNFYEIFMAMRSRFSVMKAENPDADFNDILNNSEVYLGEGRVGAYTETGRTMTERCMDRLARVPFLNETAIGAAVSVTIAAGAWFSKSFARRFAVVASGASTAIGAMGIGAGVAGAIGGLRAMNTTRLNRAFQGRRAEMGMMDDNPEVHETLYKMKEATELTDQLGLLYSDEGEFRLDDPTTSMQLIAEATARLRLSARRRKGFIRTTEQEGGPKRAEQMKDLFKALSKTKSDLRRVLQDAIAAGDDDVLRSFGILDERLTEVKDADDPLEAVLEPVIAGNEGVLSIDVMGEINADIAEKDRAHRKLMFSKGWKTALISAGTALTFGIVSQEAVAGIFEKQHGLFGGKQGQSETILQRLKANSGRAFNTLFSRDGDEQTVTATSPNGEQVLGQTKIVTQEGVNVAQSPDGSFTVNGPDGAHVEGVNFTSTGNLTDESLKTLNAKGFHINTASPEYVTPPAGPPIEKQVNGAQFVEQNKDNMVQVKRHWMLNERKGPHGETPYYDKNELKLYNPHLQQDGRIKISIHDMTKHGSYNGKYHVDWRNANMKMAFTVSNGTSDRVMWVDVDQNGDAYVDKNQNADLYGMFKPSGRSDPTELRFQGKWTQPVNDNGPDANGVHRVDVLATDVGANTNNFTTTIFDEPEPVPVTPYTITYTPPDAPVIFTPIIPIYARRGLNVNERRAPGAPGTPPVIPPTTPPGGGGGPTSSPQAPPVTSPFAPFTPNQPPTGGGPTPLSPGRPYFVPTPEDERANKFGLPSAERNTPPTGNTDNARGTEPGFGPNGTTPGNGTKPDDTQTKPSGTTTENATPGSAGSDDTQTTQGDNTQTKPTGTAPDGGTQGTGQTLPPQTSSSTNQPPADNGQPQQPFIQTVTDETLAGMVAGGVPGAFDEQTRRQRERENAQRDAEQQHRNEQKRAETRALFNDLRNTPAPNYPFRTPLDASISEEAFQMVSRAVARALTDLNIDLNSAVWSLPPDEPDRLRALRLIHRRITKYLHPDRFGIHITRLTSDDEEENDNELTPDEQRIVEEAIRWWNLPGNSSNHLRPALLRHT